MLVNPGRPSLCFVLFSFSQPPPNFPIRFILFFFATVMSVLALTFSTVPRARANQSVASGWGIYCDLPRGKFPYPVSAPRCLRPSHRRCLRSSYYFQLCQCDTSGRPRTAVQTKPTRTSAMAPRQLALKFDALCSPPQKMAPMAVSLCSHAGSYINIAMNGG